MTEKTVYMFILILYMSNGSLANSNPSIDSFAKNKTNYRKSAISSNPESRSQVQKLDIETNLINRDNHESPSAATLNSFYDNFQSSKKSAPQFQQTRVSQQATRGITHPNHQQAIALGQGNNILRNPTSNLGSDLSGPPVIMASSSGPYNSLTTPFNTFASPSIYAQTANIPVDEQQNVVSYFVNSVDGDGQMVEVPQYTNEVGPVQNPGQFASSASDLYNNPYVQANIRRRHQGQYRMTQAQTPEKEIPGSKPSGMNDNQPEPKKELASEPGKQNMLTNKQLMSLIDELKEFNSRQTSKIQSEASAPRTGQSAPDDEESSQSQEDSKPKKQKKKKNDEADPEVEPTKDDNTEKKPDSEELAKFAKFLMTKEGANIKFQLGLDKDSPDDGDDDGDDRDVLLESKKKPTKAKPKPFSLADLDDFDKKHKEVANQMEKLIKEVTGKKTKAAKKNRKVKTTAKKIDQDDIEEVDDDDAKSDRARKRRDSKVTNEQKMDSNKRGKKDQQPNQIKGGKKRESENFAKKLIKQEMLEDQLESTQTSPKNIEPETGTKAKQSPMSESSLNRPVVSTTKMKKGEKNEKYSRNERLKDHIDLIHDLQKTRKKKDKARSRLSMPGDSIVKRAMQSGTGMRAEMHPDGRLFLKTDDNAVLSLKLPKKNAEKSQEETSDNEDDTVDSELNLSRQEPDSAPNVEKVKLQSGKPIEDAYPISEKVSDRLNKLSNNLDKYFNDGFIQEIEEKAKFNAEAEGKESYQPESSDRNEDLKSRANRSKSETKDKDFDVNVGVDGKKDSDKDDAEDHDYDEDKDEKPISTQRKKPSSKRPVKRSESKKSRRSPQKKANKKRLQADKSTHDGSQVRNVLGIMTAGKKNVEYEQSGKLLPSLDPVESESLETPIGPDGDNNEPELAISERSQSMRASKVQNNYGRNATGKFFEEPSW